jgi:peptide/nickel transport system substrate-binding protein
MINLKPTPAYAWKLDAVSKIECPDKYTVVITLKEPRAALLGFLADPWLEILPKEVEEKYGDFMKSETAIGAGPFMLKEYTPDVGQVYVKNPTYFRAKEGLPYVDELRSLVILDASTTLAGFRAGQIDIRSISRLDLPSVLQTNPGIKCYQAPITASISHLTPRVDKPPLNDVRVRRAISMALDQQAIIDSFYLGYGVEAHGPVNPGSKYYLQDQGECAKYGKYNPEEAKKLLAEAGYPNGFDSTLNVSLGYGTAYEEYAEFWADSLAKIGIKAKIKKIEYAAGVSIMATGLNEDLWWKYNYGDGLDPDEQVWMLYMPGQQKNWAKVNDPKLAELAEAQRRAKNDEERKRILDEVQRYEACQLNYIAWPQAYPVRCMHPWVHNFQAHAAEYISGQFYEIVWVDQSSPTRKK